jgi:hypothetical protein
MALSPADKMRIASAYAPILYFHTDEAFVPIKPESFLKAAALWRAQPATDTKTDWGEGGPAFPRRPLIPKFGIATDPAQDFEGLVDTDGDDVGEWYLAHQAPDQTRPYLFSSAQRELWLDSSGWKDAQDVTDTSVNRHCNRDGALEKWKENPQQLTRTFSDWYSSEVLEPSDIERLLISLGEADGKSVRELIREFVGEMWIVLYYFLYPVHEEYLRRCEQVFEDASKRGDYEGDWNAVAVVVKKPAVLPWLPGGQFEAPIYSAYGVRLRGLGEQFLPTLFKQGMLVKPWAQTSRIGNHPRVFVAKGYHNNYHEAGDHAPAEPRLLSIPLAEIACEVTEEVDEAVNDVEEFLEDVGEVAKDVTITVAKIAAGAAAGVGLLGFAGAALGAAAGAIAGIIEAVSSSNEENVPSEEVRKELEKETGPVDKRYGLVLTPSGIDPLLQDPQHPENNESATDVRTWNGTDFERLVDRDRQIWWPDEFGFNGRWGVRVEDDPNDRRSGITFPDFKRVLLNDIALHIAETDS